MKKLIQLRIILRARYNDTSREKKTYVWDEKSTNKNKTSDEILRDIEKYIKKIKEE